MHTSRADGGNGECEADGACQPPAAPGTGFADHIVPAEAGKVLDHMLGNDPRPHYVHQPQLTEDRTLYPLLDRVVGDYRAWFADNRPLVVPTMTQSAQELGRQRQWAEAVADGRVRASLENGPVTVVVDSVDLVGPPAGRTADARPVRGVRRSVRRPGARRGYRSVAGSRSRRWPRGAAREGGTVKVALITEGTYPLHAGGVSAWCDQLVRGLPEVRFEVVALSGSGREPVAFTPPGNVAAVRRVGLWARVPRGKPFTGRTTERFAGAYP